MLEPFRSRFNEQQFSAERYSLLKARLEQRVRTEVEFRVCETPCFFPRALMERMEEIGRVLTHQLVDCPEYMRRSNAAVPDEFRIPNDNPRPNFMTVDFGLVRDAAGELRPKLVELQAFPSVYGYQQVLTEEYLRTYELGDGFDSYFGGMGDREYWEVLGRTILNGHDPEQVVLTEVEPETQKTRPDFNVYADRLGVRTVDIATLKKEGRRLFYLRDGVWTPIRRIYNRAIVDEMVRRQIRPAFDYRDELEVEWAGQPNWYFRISKFSLPWLEHESVPRAVFLDDWFRGDRRGLPEDRGEILLKPLYSFAGKGIQFAPTDADLRAIPEGERGLYLLQERMHFEPVIRTPHGLTQAEVRIMYCWPEGAGEMIPMTCLVRLGRGLMMGVDQNRNQEWVGGSSALLPI